MKKKVFIVLGALVGVVAAWMILFPGKTPWNMKGSASQEPTPLNPIPASTTTQNGSFQQKTITGQPEGFPLYPDPTVYKKDVALLQSVLNDFFGSSLVVDGLFGPKTLASLKANGYAQNDYLTYQEFSDFEMMF